MRTNIAENSEFQSAKAWAEYLKNQDWTHFATFTTPYELTLKSTRRLMERYGGRLTRITADDFRLFWCAEKFECKDGYHAHGLLKVPKHVCEFPAIFQCLIDSYQEVTGAKFVRRENGKSIYNQRSRIDLRKYHPERGGAKYCAKYLCKGASDYDLIT